MATTATSTLSKKSETLSAEACGVMPGGNTRHTVYYPPYPIYADHGDGAYVVDPDGNRYIDCNNNMSALIHGHGHPRIVTVVQKQAAKLMSAGMPTAEEVALARQLVQRVPSLQKIRFANSGTEANMFALRAARAFTGRNKVAKVEGGYHGSYDAIDMSNRPGPDAWGPADRPNTVADTQGLSTAAKSETVIFTANDIENTRRLLEENADELAAVFIDPVVSKIGFLELTADFLAMIREETRRLGIVLIFDEVFSFRLGLTGAQGRVGIDPDLSTFGKIIGGGMPIGAFGGREDIMEVFDASSGAIKVEHGGTFNANPMAMVAGLEALKLFNAEAVDRLNGLGDRLRDGLNRLIANHRMAGQATGVGSLTGFFFSDAPILNYRTFAMAMAQSDGLRKGGGLHRALLELGVLIIPPGGLILSTAMDETIVDAIIEAFDRALSQLKEV